jgi:hypothetical protein
VIFFAVQHTQHLQSDVHIFTNSLNSLHFLANCLCQPSSQHNHIDKLLIAKINFHIQHTPHQVSIQKERAHNQIIGNEEADKLAKHGSSDIPIPLSLSPYHLIRHHTLCWPPIIPTSTQLTTRYVTLKDTLKKNT